MREFLSKIPIPTAGVALGVVALGSLLQPFSEIFHLLCGVIAACLVVLLLAKVCVHPRTVKHDFENSILASVSATCFMAIMQLAVYIEPVVHNVAFVIWCAAIACHFALIIWFTKTYILHFSLLHVFPTYFIAYVGIIVASLTSPAFGAEAFGMGVFWFGFVCYLILLVVVTLRYIKHEVPEAARPLICIYAAPMSLSLVGYLSACDNPQPLFVAVLLVAAQLLYLFVLLVVPRLMKLNFYPSYAAMTFPFVVTALGLTKAEAFFASIGWMLPSWIGIVELVETLIAAFMVCYVLVYYLRYFVSCVPRKEKQEHTEPASAHTK